MTNDLLRSKDEQADGVIATWSFAAFGANLLPPPFDLMVVGAVFARMGSRLAAVYEIEMSRARLLELGVAVAKGTGAVLGAAYVGMGLLKFIPGVNLWAALLLQPPIVAAVAYAAGQAFKSYYHAMILEGRRLSAAEVAARATEVLRAKLTELRSAGHSFSPRVAPPSDSAAALVPAAEAPIETVDYHERRFLLVLGPSAVNSHARDIANRVAAVRVVTGKDVTHLNFSPGHPTNFGLYVGHPLKPTVYYAAHEFHASLFDDKLAEASRMLRHLGATYIRIERRQGYSREVSLKMTAKALLPEIVQQGAVSGATARLGGQKTSSDAVMFEQTLGLPTRKPELPGDLVWFGGERMWKEIADARMEQGLQRVVLKVEARSDFSIDADLEKSFDALKVLKIKLNVTGSLLKHQDSLWDVHAEFAKADGGRSSQKTARVRNAQPD